MRPSILWPHLSNVVLALAVMASLTACTASDRRDTSSVPPLTRLAVERAIKLEVLAAYDFSKPNVVDNLMALYAPSGIVSASGGQIVTSRDSIRLGISEFWTNVGRNMRDPRVEWTAMHIDVLSPTAAVLTATYRIPHRQPNGLPHVIGGAWTAVFVKQHERWVIVQEHLSDNPFAH